MTPLRCMMYDVTHTDHIRVRAYHRSFTQIYERNKQIAKNKSNSRKLNFLFVSPFQINNQSYTRTQTHRHTDTHTHEHVQTSHLLLILGAEYRLKTICYLQDQRWENKTRTEPDSKWEPSLNIHRIIHLNWFH